MFENITVDVLYVLDIIGNVVSSSNIIKLLGGIDMFIHFLLAMIFPMYLLFVLWI